MHVKINKEVVNVIRPVEPFATGIKIFDAQKFALIA